MSVPGKSVVFDPFKFLHLTRSDSCVVTMESSQDIAAIDLEEMDV
jgi:hypothetical protein